MRDTETFKIKILLLLCFMPAAVGVQAQHPEYKFEYLTMEDGLSQSSVNCTIQDSTGFLWFGTQSGLNRYDGYEFRIFNHDPFDSNSITDNWIHVIVEAEPGVLWLGTWSEGLNRFDTVNKKITRYVHKPGDKNGLIHNSIWALCLDSGGALWIGTRGGLDLLEPGSETFTHYLSIPGDPASLSHPEVTAIYEDHNNTLWIGTSNGLNRFNRQSGIFTHFFFHPGDPGSLSSNEISAITGDRKGNLWVGTKNSGLNRMLPGQNRFQRFKHDPAVSAGLCSNTVSSLLIDTGGSLWVGTGNIESHGNGLSRLVFNEESGKWDVTNHHYKPPGITGSSTPSHYLSDHTIHSIYEDRGGTLWFGSFQGGVNKLNRRRAKFHHYSNDPENPHGISGNSVLSFHEDAVGNMWIGTYSGGLNRFDRENRRFTHYMYDRNIPGTAGSDSIWAIFSDPSGQLWLGTGGSGIILFNPDTERFTPFAGNCGDPLRTGANTITRIKEDSSGFMWVASWNRGLFLVDKKTREFHHYPTDPNTGKSESIIEIFEDSENVMWIGSYGEGLIKAIKAAGDGQKPVTLHFTFFQRKEGDKSSISSNYVNCLLEKSIDGKKYLWVATTYGVNRFDRESGTFTCFSEADGLCNNLVYGMVEDGEYLWLTTNGGLSRFNTRTKTFRNYDTGDGIQGMEFNQGAYYKSRGGEIFVGGINGINTFFPGSVTRNPNPPPIVVTHISTFGKALPLPKAVYATDRIRLTHKDRFFSFEFAALDFENPGKNRYAYKLEGFNDNWIECGDRRYVSFSNLTGGEFVFRVKGSNNDGVWSPEGTAVHISITPPFFHAWWFRGMATAVLICLFLLLLHFRTRRLKQEMDKKHLEDQLKLKTDFTAMLVHDLRNPLQCIIGYSDLMTEETVNDDARHYNSRIRQSSDTMLRLINDMLDISKFEAGKMVIHPQVTDLAEIVIENILLMEPLLGQNANRFERRIQSLPPIDVDQVRISQVINNLLANAVKFSPQNGVITVTAKTVRENEREFQEISVADQGPGIPEEKQKDLFSQYAQLKAKSRGPVKGTGLGLAVSRLIVEAHQGTIGYRDANPTGSIFFFRIPLKK